MAQTATAPNPSKRSDWMPEPVGERILVRAFSTYEDAKRAVDRLRVARWGLGGLVSEFSWPGG